MTTRVAAPEEMRDTHGESRTRHLGRGHLVPLDGLRGIAILAVMASHLFAVNWFRSLPIRIIGQTLYWGLWGVDLFFVLSGFLITGILVDSVQGPDYFRNFYMRRVLRIFPLYYGLLFALFALTPVLHLQWHGMQVPFLLYLQNLAPFQPHTDLQGVSLIHLWSLAIEEQFYLMWPLVVFLARTPRRVLQVAIGGSVLALCYRLVLWGVWQDGHATHFNVFARADSLLIGAVLAVLYRGPVWPRVQQWSVPVLAVFGSTVVAYMFLFKYWPFSSGYWGTGWSSSVVAITFGCLLVLCLRPGPWSRICSTPILRFFGKYSYGLYVLHYLIMSQDGRLRAILLHATGSKFASVLGTAVIIVAASSLAAWLSYHLFEKHFLRLKRYFEYQPGPATR